MTRHYVILSETISVENKNKGIPISTMWCENHDFSVLGDSLYDCYENDNIQKQCEDLGERLVDGTW